MITKRLVALAAAALALIPAQAAVAAPGATGKFQTPYAEDNDNGGYMRFRGWAYNGSTVPSQEVYFTIHAETFAPDIYASVAWRDYKTGVHVANDYRPDVKSAYHLATAYVGFDFTYHLPTGYNFTNQGGKACMYVRDHGTQQAWIRVSCLTIPY